MIRRLNSGFTLLEVLIALTVLAVAMGALVTAASDYAANQSHLRDRTFSMWVARNVMLTYQLSGSWPEVGEDSGEMEMGRREWRWIARTSGTEEKRMRRLDVEVMLLDAGTEEPVSTLSGFLREPVR